MTVGIAVSCGQEAIALTDSQTSSYQGRHSNSVDKMSRFDGENPGILFGAGPSNLVERMVQSHGSCSSESIEGFVDALYALYKDETDRSEKSYLSLRKEDLKKKLAIIDDESKRAEYCDREISEIFQDFGQYKYSKDNYSCFVVVSYDKAIEKIRIFRFDSRLKSEHFSNHIQIGSGIDAANLYLISSLQGLSPTELSFPDSAFFALNAYSMSTINTGVGGTPRIALVSKNGSEFLPKEKSIALVNISGAHVSGYRDSILTQEKTREMIREVMAEENPDYKSIARSLRLNKDTLTTAYIPYSSWMERANL
jgi:hypothetical protein